ncbi:L-aspartate oxidase [Desulfitobacterium dehalogenans ATCC 51507]|uniref:L-aspartate oxidase n=1 Tax=Desulfitobacterium dehalogenans (strain ATCC 51507 / DSM 9161 / JW/IU-DC1) TaxID=756499 RepID=I4A3T4_DESDJ|nr:L-aspartate oxidase [Desulfitobacterium dehalogenans]AFL98618.1 L-aspartate oxidase [Desulfitobacterium dehalogenans ATCC 51507]
MRRYLVPWRAEECRIYSTGVLVLGSGIAGLYTALKASEYFEVTVLTKKGIPESNTKHAQGGIAVALDQEDSPSLHYEDTLYAGAGLCESDSVRVLVEDGPLRVEELIRMGAHFDRKNGKLAFTQEAAHSRRRILHANGDATGEEIERTLIAQALGEERILVKEEQFLLDLLKNQKGEVIGVLSLNGKTQELEIYLAQAVVLATGGLGQLYCYTTNPEVATGDGMAAAYRAGAQLMDMEFVQFHPTALFIPGAPRFLISEAVRGEGAHLLNVRGERFMEDISGKELAPRDVVAREIWREQAKGEVYLDFRPIGLEKVKQRFPMIYQTCLDYGINVLEDRLPVAPAAHYMMGGVRTDEMGRTSLPNLYASGECACNGVHGANRLASNSLLDGLVFGGRIVEDIVNTARSKGLMDPQLSDIHTEKDESCPGYLRNQLKREELQELMWEYVGIIREEEGLKKAIKLIGDWDRTFIPEREIAQLELKNLLAIGHCVARAALAREESRGGHYRWDYPETHTKDLKHSIQTKEGYDVCTIPVSRVD